LYKLSKDIGAVPPPLEVEDPSDPGILFKPVVILQRQHALRKSVGIDIVHIGYYRMCWQQKILKSHSIPGIRRDNISLSELRIDSIRTKHHQFKWYHSSIAVNHGYYCRLALHST
jgi:hypothetical protein